MISLFRYIIGFIILCSSSLLLAEDTPPRKIRTFVGFAHKKWEGAKGFNSHQVRVDRCLDLMSAHMDGNKLILKLRSNDKWTYTNWGLRYPASICPFPIRVRYFDENGEYLGRFITEEQFIPRWGYKPYIAEVNSDAIILEDEGTEVVYRINARDANYIEIVEISMPVRYNPDSVGPDTDYPDLLSRGDDDPSEETEEAKKTRILEEKRKAIFEPSNRYRRERFQELDAMTQEQREELGIEPEYNDLKLELKKD